MNGKPNHKTRKELLEKVRLLADDILAPRAAEYDRHKAFPKEDFDDLFAAGLMGSLVSKEFGGLGLGHHKGDILSHWLMTKEIARANMSLARCWEGHGNAMLLLDNIGTQAQKEKWFGEVIDEGKIWSAWSGEPQTLKPGEKQRFGTTVKETPEGFVVNGTKIFCSSATGAHWAILFVSAGGMGGARHSTSPEDLIMLACDLSDHSIDFDGSWWDPIGMRASVSYLVQFNNTFIPRENLLGFPGQYLVENWQTRLTPQYAVTYLGGAEAAYDHTLKYIEKRSGEADPYTQHRIAKMFLHIQTCNFWIEKTAHAWETGETDQAMLLGSGTRYLIEQLAMETVDHAIHICGARALIRPSALERIYRDLSFYVRHDNDDQVLATVGRSLLGQSHDASFFSTKKINSNEQPTTLKK